MLWELFGSDARVAAALAQSKGYDISPKNLSTVPDAVKAAPDICGDAAEDAAVDVTCALRYRTPRA